MARSPLETRIAINTIALVVLGVGLGVAFTVGAVALRQWAWLVAVPMDVAGVALLVVGARTRARTHNARGTAPAVGGGLLVVGSIWAAFCLGNLLSR